MEGTPFYSHAFTVFFWVRCCRFILKWSNWNFKYLYSRGHNTYLLHFHSTEYCLPHVLKSKENGAESSWDNIYISLSQSCQHVGALLQGSTNDSNLCFMRWKMINLWPSSSCLRTFWRLTRKESWFFMVTVARLHNLFLVSDFYCAVKSLSLQFHFSMREIS